MVKVAKLTWVEIDAGTIVNPDGARAQVEGAVLWGLSMALLEGTDFANGQVRDTNLDTYTPLRIGDVPEFDIDFVESTEAPVGLGEPATTVVGAGDRQRDLRGHRRSSSPPPDPPRRRARRQGEGVGGCATTLASGRPMSCPLTSAPCRPRA